MKAFILPSIFLISFTLLSFADPFNIKRISDNDFRYEFYTIDKKVKPKKGYTYSWFKGGLIHEAQSGITGELLDDEFTKMYHSNQLAEQGKFRKGLRVGEWKTWHKNGVLSSIQIWSGGLRSGKFLKYDLNGNLEETGYYISNLKTGKWINVENGDTINYKRGVAITKKQKYTKLEKYTIKQENIKQENIKDTQKEVEATSDAAKLTALKAKTKEEKAIANAKEKKEKESKIAADKAERAVKKEAEKQAKNQPKKDSKVETFFKNLFKKKDKTPK